MSQLLFQVQANFLTYRLREKAILIEVGTPQWFDWLESATSFSYVSPAGNFTARKERIGSPHKNWYWKAYRKLNGKLYRIHLGKDRNLTPERLSQVAQDLAGKTGKPSIQNEKLIKQTNFKATAVPIVEPLIATKLHLPQNRNGLTRSRLIERLKNAHQARLILVSAPPGFGKTTLVADWLTTRQPNYVGWFSIDEADNDPAHFWRYFTRALANMPVKLVPEQEKAPKNWLDLPASPGIEQLLVHLINRIAKIKEDIFLVLDDYHLITSEAIGKNLAYFLDRISEHFHLIIISRIDPALPLPRLRARKQLIEIKAADLRFTVEEISHYLSRVTNLPFSTEQLATLEERTEGWIAALQMLALSLQERKDLDKFIASFRGTHHYLFDYLTEEVFIRQPQEVQDFLLKSAIVERLSAELVQEVTGYPQGQRLLENLEQSNLFLIRLDEARDWFRYHLLFKEYLYKRLEQYFPDQIALLHCKAANWFARKNNLKEAIRHYLQGQSFEEAALLVEQIAQTMLMQGEIFTLENWLKALPQPTYQHQPDLYLLKAWVFVTNGQVEAAEELLKSSLMHFGAEKSEMVAIRTMLAILKLDLAQVFELAGQGLEKLPEHTPFWRDLKLLIEGVANALQGNLEEANRAYSRALHSSRKNGNLLVAMIALGQLGELMLQQGQLKQAVSVYREVLSLTRPVLGSSSVSTMGIGPTYLGMFEALYEWNKLEEAGYYVEETAQLAQKYEDGLLLIFSKVLVARYYLAQGLAPRALELVDTIWPKKNKNSDTSLTGSYSDLYRVQILVACNKYEQVVEWLQDFEATQALEAGKVGNGLELLNIVLAQVLIYLKRPDQAIALLSRSLEISRQNKRFLWTVRALIWRAVAYYKNSLIKEASDSLEQALDLAEPNEMIRSFVDSDPCIAMILDQLKTRPLSKTRHNYLNSLLRAFGQTGLSNSSTTLPNLVEPLTERELEILKLLQSGLTNKELAAKLIISVGTVAWHLKNLYAKLAVRNRTEAISHAKELNLI